MRRRLFLSLLILAAIICGLMLYRAYSEVRRAAVSALIAQQTTLARQAAQSIGDFFAYQRRTLETMGRNPRVVDAGEQGQALLRDLQRENAGETLALTRIDAAGRIIFSCPDNSVAGRDISSQDHVKRMLADHRPVVSDIFTAVQGQRGVALSVPVFKGDRFDGALNMLIAFDVISKRYLEGLRVAQSGYAFLLSQAGTLLYSPTTEFEGSHLQEISSEFPEIAAMSERMVRGESGEAVFEFDRSRDRQVRRIKKIAVFLPIFLENTFWSICVATPEDEALANLERFRDFMWPIGAAVLAIVSLALALFFRHFPLQREIVKRRETEAALRESESKYRQIIERISDVFYRTDANGALDMVSPSGVALLGYDSMQELLGRPNESFWLFPEQRAKFLALLKEHGEVRDFEVVLRRKDGKPVHVSTSSRLNRDAVGKVIGVEGIFRDITKRKNNEERLSASLHEKEVLLKEVHHRVKNNLQIISSLLHLQAENIREPQVAQALKESQSRVGSMAAIHEELYRSENFSQIDLAHYVRFFVPRLTGSYNIDKKSIGLDFDLSHTPATIEQAIPFALILNELLTNAIRHGLSGDIGADKRIAIGIVHDGNWVTARIADNGRGLPEGFDLEKAASLGMNLVNTLTSQLHGRIKAENENGAVFTLSFPLAAQYAGATGLIGEAPVPGQDGL